MTVFTHILVRTDTLKNWALRLRNLEKKHGIVPTFLCEDIETARRYSEYPPITPPPILESWEAVADAVLAESASDDLEDIGMTKDNIREGYLEGRGTFSSGDYPDKDNHAEVVGFWQAWYGIPAPLYETEAEVEAAKANPPDYPPGSEYPESPNPNYRT